MNALALAHERGVVDRDIKPDNIVLPLGPSGEIVPKLIDFGISKLIADATSTEPDPHLTVTGSPLGTPHYMSPEQVRGDGTVDGRSDIWSVASVLYELLAGRHVYEAPSYNLLVLNSSPRNRNASSHSSPPSHRPSRPRSTARSATIRANGSTPCARSLRRSKPAGIRASDRPRDCEFPGSGEPITRAAVAPKGRRARRAQPAVVPTVRVLEPLPSTIPGATRSENSGVITVAPHTVRARHVRVPPRMFAALGIALVLGVTSIWMLGSHRAGAATELGTPHGAFFRSLRASRPTAAALACALADRTHASSCAIPGAVTPRDTRDTRMPRNARAEGS